MFTKDQLDLMIFGVAFIISACILMLTGVLIVFAALNATK
jgi:hypothetical protein